MLPGRSFRHRFYFLRLLYSTRWDFFVPPGVSLFCNFDVHRAEVSGIAPDGVITLKQFLDQALFQFPGVHGFHDVLLDE